MKHINFTKMHGCGNNYIYIDCTAGRERVPDDPEKRGKLAEFLSDKNFGIGSDGMILIEPSERADFFMDMYNNDGSRGKMCGNGIRCVAKYVYENGLTDKTDFDIDTLSGVKHISLILGEGEEDDASAFCGGAGLGLPKRRNSVRLVTVDMGSASFVPAEIPVVTDKEIFKNEPITAGGVTYRSTCVSMGNPHCVTFIDDVEGFDLEGVGSVFESMDIFPEKVNAEFAEVRDRGHVRMRVYERGTGITAACGTGACATAAAANLCGLTDNKVEIELDGGALEIELRSGKVFMSGPAAYVCSGVVEVPEI